MSDTPIAINIDVDYRNVSDAIDRLKSHLKSKTFMETIGKQVADQGKARIRSRENTAPDGKPWVSLAASAIARKKRLGRGDKGMLQLYGRLADRITFQDATDDSVSIGADLVYAMIHQRGGNAGRGLKAKIPARPYIGLSAGQKKQLEEKVTVWVKKLIEG